MNQAMIQVLLPSKQNDLPFLLNAKNCYEMKLIHCADYGHMSRLCSDSIISALRVNDERLICTATGISPQSVYEHLVNHSEAEPGVFESLSVIKLDEWGGVPADDPGSCERFIREKLLRPLYITQDRYISFDGNSKNPQDECKRVQEQIARHGPIDICILGLGKNGHIGFNEPSSVLMPHCHVSQLSAESLQHQMVDKMGSKPEYGLTLGMADILQSKKIVLLVTGKSKKAVIQRLLSQEITTQLPASFLWLHPNAECYIDANAL